MPAAETSSTTPPSGACGSSTSRSCRTSGPPNSVIWMARMRPASHHDGPARVVVGTCPPMDFAPTDRRADFAERLTAFMDEHVSPAEAVFEDQIRESGDPHFYPPIMDELKEEARRRGL